ncbi:hypothetical protein [Nostoc sp.]|uniref:hypothetical protein n=1 Tax=Nostoc sp. TaxID=1180 RepID=UPI002FF86732
MGVSVLYSAIPPCSTLYTRLQREKALSILVVYLFPYGCGIFRFFEIEPEEINEILEDIIETHQEAFGSELDDFERWKDLYLSGAEKNEEILVAVA